MDDARTMTPLPPAVRSLFAPPFKTDRELTGFPRSIFLYDADMSVAASRHVLTGLAIPRGYGRHQYLPNGDARHDAWCAWFHANVPGSATLDETATILNDAWKSEPSNPEAVAAPDSASARASDDPNPVSA